MTEVTEEVVESLRTYTLDIENALLDITYAAWVFNGSTLYIQTCSDDTFEWEKESTSNKL